MDNETTQEEALNTAAITKYYLFGGQRVAMRVGTGPQSAVYYLHGDHLGSVSMTTNASGEIESQMRFTPFGEELTVEGSGSSPTDFGYTSQRNDGFGLMDYNARFYSASLGRFISPDSIIPGAGNPMAYDRYQYVFSNPLGHTDPSGHGPCKPGYRCAPTSYPSPTPTPTTTPTPSPTRTNTPTPTTTPSPIPTLTPAPTNGSVYVSIEGAPNGGTIAFVTIDANQDGDYKDAGDYVGFAIVTHNHYGINTGTLPLCDASGCATVNFKFPGQTQYQYGNSVDLNLNTPIFVNDQTTVIPLGPPGSNYSSQGAGYTTVADPATISGIQVGDTVQVVYNQADTLSSADFIPATVSLTVTEVNGNAITVQAPNGYQYLQPGDSGSGVYYNGEFIGNIWAIGVTYPSDVYISLFLP